MRAPTVEEIVEWWEWNFADDFERDMRELGYAVVPRDFDELPDAVARVALVAEARWRPVGSWGTPSRLWDAGTPSTAI